MDPTWDWDFLLRDVDPAMLVLVDGASPDTKADMLATVIANSPPVFDRAQNGQPIGLWITLTIAGVTRKGYGSVEPGKFDAEKQLIGDALRNAAMRFGVALTLWSKTSWSPRPTRRTTAPGPNAPPPMTATRRPAMPRWTTRPTRRPSGPATRRRGGRSWGTPTPTRPRRSTISLRAIYGAVRNDCKEPIRAWLVDNGYTTRNDQDLVQAVPFPVAKRHVPEYRDILVAARDRSSQVAAAPGNSTAERLAAESQETAHTPPLPRNRMPRHSCPRPPLRTHRRPSPDDIPQEELDRIVAEVEAMKVPERKERLRALGLPVTGNAPDLGQRLARALALNWYAREHPAPAPEAG